jgi:hypothetical protein
MKTLMLLINIIDLILIFVAFLFQGKITFILLVVLLLLLLLQMFLNITLRSKRGFLIRSILVTIFSLLLLFPISFVGFKYGPTLGRQISYRYTLWEKPWDRNLRFYMSRDVIATVIKNKSSLEDIKQMLGEPDSYDSNRIEYFLRSESFIGLSMTSLIIELENNRCINAYIVHSD